MTRPDDGFALPDWQAPLDAGRLIALAPEEGRVKGLFYQDLVSRAGAQGPLPGARPKYQAFMDYPLREWMALAVAFAQRVHPGETLRSGLRLVGRGAFPLLSSTLLGKTIFGFAGRNFGAVLDVASRGYAVSMTPGTVTVVERGEGRARVELRQIWNFPDAYQVGVFEGTASAMGLTGEVRIRSISPCDVDFAVRWGP
jgi:uncharacterized protein (TIGR02265 family)